MYPNILNREGHGHQVVLHQQTPINIYFPMAWGVCCFKY